GEVELIVLVAGFQKREKLHDRRRVARWLPSRWKHLVGGLIVMQRETELLQIIQALRPRRCLAHLLHRRYEEGDQDGNNGNDYDQLDERKSLTFHGSWALRGWIKCAEWHYTKKCRKIKIS